MKQKILTLIASLQHDRESRHIVPPHVLLTEIINRGIPHPQPHLNALVQEGYLSWHKTLNDIAFTISQEPPTK